ncbi:disrupted in schizophrenia 1 homolog [Gopherus flavomarginatus]|uniref:disrupted in schizophrenia 1 homolog n=1 Tax=Gopherus flavomarginatus TaxID=286002 RepID=UPI0021CC203A|nr:disrupted in schizophrenia 1 homolog [Gopherus flavomarginatus]
MDENAKSHYGKKLSEFYQEDIDTYLFDDKMNERFHLIKNDEICASRLPVDLCGNQLLERVWEADLEACQLLIQGFQLKEAGCCVSEGEEGRTDEMDAADNHCSDTERGKESHFPKGTEQGAVPYPTAQTKCCELKEVVEDISFGTDDHLCEDFHLFSAELGEKCEAISEKLVQLEDQLQTSVCSLDDSFIHILFLHRLTIYLPASCKALVYFSMIWIEKRQSGKVLKEKMKKFYFGEFVMVACNDTQEELLERYLEIRN